jgi:hypothetical protein
MQLMQQHPQSEKANCYIVSNIKGRMIIAVYIITGDCQHKVLHNRIKCTASPCLI